MKTIVTILLILISPSIFSQKLTKKQGLLLLNTNLSKLTSNDSVGFYSMWDFSHKTWPYHTRAFDLNDLKSNYAALKEFLNDNSKKQFELKDLEIYRIDENETGEGIGYLIKGWFNYSTNEIRAIGYHVISKNGEWKFINSPEYTSLNNESKSND